MTTPPLVLGLLGSPRRHGNAALLLAAALDAARAAGAVTETVILNDLQFRPCQACPDAPRDGSCLLRDDLQRVYPLLERAHGIVLASPLYFGSLSAQTKMFIDRLQCRWQAREAHRTLPRDFPRRGALIVAAATAREDFYRNARSVAANFFATAGARFAGELFCPDCETAGAAARHPDCLTRAAALGREVAACS